MTIQIGHFAASNIVRRQMENPELLDVQGGRAKAARRLTSAFAVVVFGDVLASIIRRGVCNTASYDPMTGAVVWFALFGGALLIGGLGVSALERSSGSLPRLLEWSRPCR